MTMQMLISFRAGNVSNYHMCPLARLQAQPVVHGDVSGSPMYFCLINPADSVCVTEFNQVLPII